MRATARVFGVEANTVRHWLVEAAEQLQIFANALHTIPFDDPDRFNSVVATFLQKPFVKIDRLGDTLKSLEKLRTGPAK